MGYVEEIRKLVGHRPMILTGSLAIIVDDKGRILLEQKKHPEGYWGIPGGLMELGESTEETAKREVFEETNLIIKDLNLINVFSGSKDFVKAANGDEFYTVAIAYYTYNYEGVMVIDKEESLDFKFYYPEQIPENVVKSHQIIIAEFLKKHYKKSLM